MGKRMRLLAVSERVVPFAELHEALADSGLEVLLTFDGTSGDDWLQLDLSHEDGGGIALVERDPLDSAAALRELEERVGRADGADHPPATAVAWLLQQAAALRALYLVRVDTALAEDPEGAEALDLILNHLHGALGGLLQADYEGFYIRAADPRVSPAAAQLTARLRAELGNLDPDTAELFADPTDWQITWDPAMDRLGVTGWRRMAVLDGDAWILFEMDAGNPAHRAAFCRSEVPAGVVPNGRRRWSER